MQQFTTHTLQDREAVRAALLQLDLPNLVDKGEQESEKLKRITIR